MMRITYKKLSNHFSLTYVKLVYRLYLAVLVVLTGSVLKPSGILGFFKADLKFSGLCLDT